jgi:hypothetical protein
LETQLAGQGFWGTHLQDQFSAALKSPEGLIIVHLAFKDTSPIFPLDAPGLYKTSIHQIFSPESNTYQVENIFSGLQRFSWLAAERPQSPHTYMGSLTKISSSFDFESGGKSQTLFVDFPTDFLRSDIDHLICSQEKI